MDLSVNEISDITDTVGAISEEQAANIEEILAKSEEINDSLKIVEEFLKKYE